VRLGPGSAVLRDYVKSMKHHWHQAAYIPDAVDRAAAWKVAARFREDEFIGGVRAAPLRAVHLRRRVPCSRAGRPAQDRQSAHACSRLTAQFLVY